jgi:hypothetical protein
VALSADGDILAIGDRTADIAQTNDGSVTVYQYDQTSYSPLGSMLVGTEQTGWGHDVDLSDDGSRLAVGAPSSNQVLLFEYTSDWSLLAPAIDGEAADDSFGGVAKLSGGGTFLVVGAMGNDGTDLGAGHVRVYEIEGVSFRKRKYRSTPPKKTLVAIF